MNLVTELQKRLGAKDTRVAVTELPASVGSAAYDTKHGYTDCLTACRTSCSRSQETLRNEQGVRVCQVFAEVH